MWGITPPIERYPDVFRLLVVMAIWLFIGYLLIRRKVKAVP